LAACVNVLDVKSVYRWEGSIAEDDEVLLIIKTSSEKVSELKKAVMGEHPYKVPEIVEINPADVNKSYLEWVIQST